MLPMLQTATCISLYEPMSDLIKVGDRCEIDTIHSYVGDDGVTYVGVYRPYDHKLGDMPLKCFSLIDDEVLTLVEGKPIDFDELSNRRCIKDREAIKFKCTAILAINPPKMYDVRQPSDEQIAEALAAAKKSTK